jgi:predicted nucleotidyltransferase component of viral defense system
MSEDKMKDVTASILQRLKNYSQARKEDRGLTITNYAIERFLYRMGVSKYADQFVLKGAQLFRMWTNDVYRPTRDLDLLRFGSSDITELEQIFREVCQTETDVQDGIVYIADSVKGQVIREENVYDGVRVNLEFRIGRTGEFMQIDIGFGDAVNPPAQEIIFPSILKMPNPKLKAYSYDTVIAEKVEAMVALGYVNSRMKDFYDVFQLSDKFEFDGQRLSNTIQQTFKRRGTDIPQGSPLAFTKEFSHDPLKQRQWNAFITKNSLDNISFTTVVDRIVVFIDPIFIALRTSRYFAFSWKSNKQWN